MKMIVALLNLSLLMTARVDTKVEHFGYLVERDASMAHCVSCHNGSRGRAVSQCGRRMCDIYANHVVEVPYPPAGKPGRYAPVEEIAIRGLALADGKIVCSTCHSLTSKKEHLLVIDLQEDRLCHACHLL